MVKEKKVESGEEVLDNGAEQEGKDESSEEPDGNVDSWGINVGALRSVAPKSRGVSKIRVRREEMDVPLERLVESESPFEEVVPLLGGGEDNYGLNVSRDSRDELAKRDGEGPRDVEDQIYSPEGDSEKGLYETRTVDVSENRVGEMYDLRTKIDPSEGSWSTNTTWTPKEMADVRGVGGSKVIDSHNLIEGQITRAQGDQDGFASMKGKPKYE